MQSNDRALADGYSQADLQAALAGMDLDQDGRVGLHEFTAWWLTVGSKIKAAIDRCVPPELKVRTPAHAKTTRLVC